MLTTAALAPPRLAHRHSLLGSENAFRIAPLIREIEARGARVLKCHVGEPDFALPAHIAEEMKLQIDRGQTHYCDPQGLESLRIAIARDVGQSRGLDITPDRVVVFPGAKPPIGFAQQVYCDPGDEVIYPSPGFPIYESFTRYVGAVPVPLHLREESGFTCTAAELAPLITKKTKLIYLNFPSNPTGGVASREQLHELAEVILSRAPEDVRVYSDEVYERILFDGAEHHSIASVPGMESRTIIVSGVSKTYAWTGGRVGWAILPTREEAEAFRNLNINYFSCVSAYSQLATKVAIESPESEPAIAAMVAEFQHRRDVIVHQLSAIAGITCQTPRGAFYLFPNIGGVCARVGAIDAWNALAPALREASSPATLFQRFLLAEYRVATLDRRSFGAIGSDGKHFLRISVATSLEDLTEAAMRIMLAADDAAGFRSFMEGMHR
jgi:aspartate aminotransferase